MEQQEYTVDIEKINNQIDEWVANNLKDFTFRKYQKEAIVGIIDKIVNNSNHNIIVEAPTGTGKSIINIIAAHILWEYYKIDSYILCSDLYLFDQYEKFIEQNQQLQNIASIKGQTGNYTCSSNREDIRSADCQLAGVSWSSLIRRDPHVISKGFRCCRTCRYVKCRDKALKAPITITTYQNLLYQLNIVYKEKSVLGGDTSMTFGPRQVIFCDEAHNIPSILQLKYTPEVRYSDLEKLIAISKYYTSMVESEEWKSFVSGMDEAQYDIYNELEQSTDDRYKDIDKLITDFNNDWRVFATPNPAIDDMVSALTNYNDILIMLNMMCKMIGLWVRHHKKGKYDVLSSDMMSIWKTSVWLANYSCNFNDFMTAWDNQYVGSKYILKQIHNDDKDANSKGNIRQQSLFGDVELKCTDDRLITFNCTKEDYLVYIGLLAWAKYRVFTSATIGGKDNFCENNGIEYTEDGFASFDRVPTIFDYTKSPINFLNRYSMSFKERNFSLPKICRMVQQLCERHKDEKGIIQTGSYAITKQLIDSLDAETQSRLLTYNGSRDKIKKAEIHKRSQNTILIGPSLNQGIDLPDDNVRFIIILKVPYPSLTDEYVKEKIRLFPRWYEAVTTTEIIQGIGRGVRNENDWCVTYILDSCFYKLYMNTLDQFSDEMRDRIKIFN